MSHLPDSADPEAWSRYFAIEANNRAWALASQPSRSTPEAREMLQAAHASAFHWNVVGAGLGACLRDHDPCPRGGRRR